MAKRRVAAESTAAVRFVPAAKPKRQKRRKVDQATGRPVFQAAVFDHYWDYWFRGVAFPLMLVGIATGMAIRGYAAIPLRVGGMILVRIGWTVFHGLDARLLALSVVGFALWCHFRGVWTEHDRLTDYEESGQTAAIFIGVGGVVAVILHQAWLVFR